jgi:hypothetical protein
VGLILGVDAGNSKTELLAATLEGDPFALVRGPGTNAHGRGADGCLADIAPLVQRAGLNAPAEHGAFFPAVSTSPPTSSVHGCGDQDRVCSDRRRRVHALRARGATLPTWWRSSAARALCRSCRGGTLARYPSLVGTVGRQ